MSCLGATKAGTSWLYEHLAAHPQCRFRTIKELHYFNLARPEHFDRAIKQAGQEIARLEARMVSAELPRQIMIARRIADLVEWQAVLARREIDLAAYRDYLTSGAADARLVGDVTPAYGLMSGATLRQMTEVAADSRFVYLIRDPLARLWSHVRMIAARTSDKDGFEAAAVSQLNRILSDDLSGEGAGIVQRGDYARILPKLRRVFAPDRLLVLFQEEMLTLPGMQRLWAFLGLDAVAVDLDRRVHEGRAFALPQNLRARALAWLRPQYDFVAAHMPVLPAGWHKNMEEGLA